MARDISNQQQPMIKGGKEPLPNANGQEAAAKSSQVKPYAKATHEASHIVNLR